MTRSALFAALIALAFAGWAAAAAPPKDPHTVTFKMMSQTQARAAGMTTQVGPLVHPFYLYGLPDVVIYPSKRLEIGRAHV